MNRRPGFTLTELLVSLALIIFIMLILTEGFSAGLETFRRLKAIGDMQERTRTTLIAMRRDLLTDHFEDSSGKERLSDMACNRGPDDPDSPWSPSAKGYFRIWQMPPAAAAGITVGTAGQGIPHSIFEGDETISGINLPAHRATTHVLQFTCRRPRHYPGLDNLRTALVPGSSATPTPLETQGPTALQNRGTMNSAWYEVAYFLRAVTDGTGTQMTTTADPGTNPTPLFALYRRERVISEHSPKTPLQTVPVGFPDVSTCYESPPGQFVVNRPEDVADPRTRLGMDRRSTGWQSFFAGQPYNFPNWSLADEPGVSTVRKGDDVLMTDVISFDVKVLQQGWRPPPPSGTGTTPDGSLEPKYFHPSFVDLPPVSLGQNKFFKSRGWSVFDTWCKEGSSLYEGVTPPPTGATPPPGYPYTRDPAFPAFPGWWSSGEDFSIPLRIRIHAIKITLRIWDAKTEQSREVTLIQDM